MIVCEGRGKETIDMAAPLEGRLLLWVREREKIQRHLEESRAERKESRLGIARAKNARNFAGESSGGSKRLHTTKAEREQQGL